MVILSSRKFYCGSQSLESCGLLNERHLACNLVIGCAVASFIGGSERNLAATARFRRGRNTYIVVTVADLSETKETSHTHHFCTCRRCRQRKRAKAIRAGHH